MKRIGALLLAVLPVLALPIWVGLARADSYPESFCQERPFMCLDKYKSIGANGEYTGHDEPTVQFTSHRPGTGGKRLLYYVTLPKDPPTKPNQGGTGGTWNFQLRATFWFSITMCDTESWPNYRKTCTANSDANAAFRSPNPSSPHYLGKGPGNAFMELQFYEPGWVPQFDGFGCTATKWCANLTIDSLSDNANTGVPQNADCLNNHFLVGEEPINWAYVTRSGQSQAQQGPAHELRRHPAGVHMHDTPAGYRVDIDDLTTGGHGSMTASIANGFGHILFEPNATQCHVAPYAFHPMYSSAVSRGTTWAAHTSNVAFSDEIGHFEYCAKADPTTGACTTPAGADSRLDVDDQACLDGAALGALIPITGCVLDDGDFDGPSYRLDWPGTFRNPFLDRLLARRAWRARQSQPAVRRDDRRQLRQPAAGRAVLSHLHRDARARHVHAAAGRPVHPGHRQRLRRHVEERVRQPAVRHLSRRWVHDLHASPGLPSRPPGQPVPGRPLS